MPPVGRRTLRSALGVASAACILLTGLLAQNEKPVPPAPPGDSDTVLRQLLTEVRHLRLAIQRSTLLGTRFQVAIERLRIQQAHVDGLGRELADLRGSISGQESELARMVERRKSAEEEMAQAMRPERAEMENNVRLLKAASTSFEREIQENRAREADLAVRVQSGQVRLDELERDLERLMKELQDQ